MAEPVQDSSSAKLAAGTHFKTRKMWNNPPTTSPVQAYVGPVSKLFRRSRVMFLFDFIETLGSLRAWTRPRRWKEEWKEVDRPGQSGNLPRAKPATRKNGLPRPQHRDRECVAAISSQCGSNVSNDAAQFRQHADKDQVAQEVPFRR